MHENDGRAPDTEGLLHPAGIRDSATQSPSSLVSYKWHNNSCFFDNGLELWYRAFSRWGPIAQAEYLRLVPKNSFLGCLVFHYDRRLKLSHTSTSSEIDAIRNNSLRLDIRNIVHCALCEKGWHYDCVETTFLPAFASGIDPWACPECVNCINGPWDKCLCVIFPISLGTHRSNPG